MAMNVDALTSMVAAARPERPAGSPSPARPQAVPAPAAERASDADPQAVVERLREVVSEINRALADARREFAFSVDETSGRTVVRVIDAQSGEVLRQIPSEETLRLASRMREGEALASLGLERWS